MADGLIFGPAPWLSLFVGAKHSGKTQCIKYVCRAYAHVFASIIVFCPTALTGACDFLPKKYVFEDYDPEVMRGIMALQEEYSRSGKKVHVLCIFDDALSSETIEWEKRKQSELSRLWSANRHWNLSVIVVTQSLKRVPLLLRTNVDYCLIFRVMREAYAGLYEAFGHTDRATFFKFIEEQTREYRVIRFKANVSNPADHFSVFKLPEAELSRRFTLCY